MLLAQASSIAGVILTHTGLRVSLTFQISFCRLSKNNTESVQVIYLVTLGFSFTVMLEVGSYKRLCVLPVMR